MKLMVNVKRLKRKLQVYLFMFGEVPAFVTVLTKLGEGCAVPPGDLSKKIKH